MNNHKIYMALIASFLMFGIVVTPELLGETDSKVVAEDVSTQGSSSNGAVLKEFTYTLAETDSKMAISESDAKSYFGLSNENVQISGLADVNTSVPGTYNVSLDFRGGSSHKYLDTYGSIIVEPVLPQISVANPNYTIYAGTLSDPNQLLSADHMNVTASRFGSGLDDSLMLSVVTEINFNTPGTFTVTFKVIDDDETSNTAVATLTIVPGSPTIEVDRTEASITEETELTYETIDQLFGIDAFDSAGNPIAFTYEFAPDLDPNMPTSQTVSNLPYEITVYALDGEMMSDPITLYLTVDAVDPTINVNVDHYTISTGDPEPTLTDILTWFDISATEINPTEFTYSFVYEDAPGIDMSKPRTYPIRVTVTDDDGATDNEVVNLQVKFVNSTTIEATEEPVYSPEGTELDEGEVATLFGAKAYDKFGELPLSVNIDEVDFYTAGNYPVYFSILAKHGDAKTVERTITITNVDPQIEVMHKNVFVRLGSDLGDLRTKFNVVASDVAEGDLSEDVMYDTPEIDGVGKYTIEFYVTDDDDVTVSDFGTLYVLYAKPEIQLAGTNTKSVPEETDVDEDYIISHFAVTAMDRLGLDIDPELFSVEFPEGFTTEFPTTEPFRIKISVSDEYDGIETDYIYVYLTVSPVDPVIMTETDYYEVELDSSPLDPEADLETLISWYGVSGYEFEDGDAVISVDLGDFDPTVAGEYTIYFMVTDDDDTTVKSDPLTLKVVAPPENQPPTLKFKRSKYVVPEGTYVSDEDLLAYFKPTVSDPEGGSVSLDMTHGVIDYMTTGVYKIAFTATDEEGLSTTKYRTLVFTDVEPSLVVNNPIVHVYADQNGNYDISDLVSKFNVVGTEIVPGDITDDIEYSDAHVTGLGTYTIQFKVEDDEGNMRTATGTLIISYAAPIIETSHNWLIKQEESNLNENQLLAAFGVSGVGLDGQELVDFTITYPVDFDWNKPRALPYELIISATDHGVTTTKEVYLTIYPKFPKLTIPKSSIELEQNTPLPSEAMLIAMFGATAAEFDEGDVTIRIDTHRVDMSKLGRYLVKFTGTDDDGQVVTKYRQIKVVRPPNQEPEIDFKPTVTITEGTVLDYDQLFSRFNPTVTDVEDGDDLPIIMTHDVINYNDTGEYTITFTTVDLDGAETTVYGTLKIVDKAPTLTFTTNPVTIRLGDEPGDLVAKFGLVGTEITTGDLTNIMYQMPDISLPGTYDIEFTVMDNEESTASVTLQLVVENYGPEISGSTVKQIDEVASTDALDLVTLFGVSSYDYEEDMAKVVEVVEGPADGTMPGTYDIVFSSTDGNNVTTYFNATLIINHVDPVVTTDVNYVTIRKDVTEYDFIEGFGALGTEFELGDLEVMIESSEVVFGEDGIYELIFKAVDDEGRVGYKTVYVIVGNPGAPDVMISGTKYLQIPEEFKLDRDKIIKLYELAATSSKLENLLEHIEIEGLDEVDFSTPGTYTLTAVVEYKDVRKEFDIVLDLYDLLPYIEAENDRVTIKDTDINIDSEKDFIALFNIFAEEFGYTELLPDEWYAEDLLSRVNVDLSSLVMKDGRYVAGTYPLTFTVTDDEGNEAETTTFLEVAATSEEEEDDPVTSEEETEVSEEETEVSEEETEVSEEETEVETDDEDDTTTPAVALMATGQTIGLLLASLVVAVIALVALRLKGNSTK